MMKRVEMIIDYITDGTDFQYSDNHGVLTRCKDCELYIPDISRCEREIIPWVESDDFCSRAVRKDDGNS